MLKIDNKDVRTTPGVVLVSLLILNIYHTFSVFIVNFEQVNAAGKEIWTYIDSDRSLTGI